MGSRSTKVLKLEKWSVDETRVGGLVVGLQRAQILTDFKKVPSQRFTSRT